MIDKISVLNVTSLHDNDKRYWSEPELFKPFLSSLPRTTEILNQIELKKKSFTNRDILVNAMMEFYKDKDISSSQKINLSALADSATFTVCTAHQPCLFGGPLFFYYKICSTIALAKNLNKQYPDYRFIPIYYCGSEDHDFDEINHAFIYSSKLEWRKDSNGPTGRNNVEGIDELLVQLKELLVKEKHSNDFFTEINTVLKNSKSYSEFFFHFVNYFFKDDGLLFLEPDQLCLKETFINVIKEECKSSISYKLVNDQIQNLNEINFSIQANPREINLFYTNSAGYRTRIINDGTNFKTSNGDVLCPLDNIENFIENNIASISPNVILRPLYQEIILPNVVFVGGGGEISYWLELKKIFDHYQVSYPILSRRLSAVIIEDKIIEKWKALNLSIANLFEDKKVSQEKYISANSNTNQEIDQVTASIINQLKHITAIAHKVDPTIANSIAADHTKLMKDLSHSNAKISKAEKAKFEIDLQKIEKIIDQLFPDKGLQERKQNWLQYALKYGNNFKEKIIQAYDLESAQFNIFTTSEFEK